MAKDVGRKEPTRLSIKLPLLCIEYSSHQQIIMKKNTALTIKPLQDTFMKSPSIINHNSVEKQIKLSQEKSLKNQSADSNHTHTHMRAHTHTHH